MIRRRRKRKRKPPFIKQFYRHLIWWTGKFVVLTLGQLPLPLCRLFFSTIFLLWHYIFRRHRRIAVAQLKEALGVDHKEAVKITRRMFQNIGKNLAEFLIFPSRPRRLIPRLVDGEEFRRKVSEALKGGKGVIIVTGHIGNWELIGAYSTLYFPTTVIAKKIYFDKYEREVARRRLKQNLDVVYQEEGIRPILLALRRNSVVGILADQDIKHIAGEFVEFFGRPAYTPSAPSRLALKSGAPLLVAVIRRIKASRHKIFIEGPVTIEKTGDLKTDSLRLTQKWTSILERLIREQPEQWVWFHRRWKTQQNETS